MRHRSLPRTPVSAPPWLAIVLALTGLTLAACGTTNVAPVPEVFALDAMPPATIDDTLQLPDGIDPVAFPYTTIRLRANGRSESLGMLVADTFERRTRGLMFRSALPADTGMVFAFPADTDGPFWNNDTHMDLDIAFLSIEGEIQEILRLTAGSTELVAPEEPYRYAVEMAAGWFATRGVEPGDRFVLPATLVGTAQ